MRDGFERLYRTHHGAVHRFVTRRLAGPDVDDIVASTFELAYRKLGDDHPQPVGWLIRTADNLVKAELRRQAREQRARRDAEVVQAGQEHRGDLDRLERLVERMPRAHREILRLTYWDELSAAQAAVVLGCSEQAARKRVSRARAALRSAWRADSPESREEAERYV